MLVSLFGFVFLLISPFVFYVDFGFGLLFFSAELAKAHLRSQSLRAVYFFIRYSVFGLLVFVGFVV